MKGVNAHTVASGKYFTGDDKVFIKKLDGGKAMTFKRKHSVDLCDGKTLQHQHEKL